MTGFIFYDKTGGVILLPQDWEDKQQRVKELIEKRKVAKIMLQTSNGLNQVSIEDFKKHAGL
ncbi:hypothetical protein [Dysgonomonas sp. 520]|uniref:hypothetical protein n=1 Tax=Dysgonomonas sp. 520 TaxID=2302931 RepID=UPI0013D8A91C|nr:hypothetical protein [Dysgonomonas sp. 520]NDW10925.1 hypothetical protein [Dysgonomonas sp. 520]